MVKLKVFNAVKTIKNLNYSLRYRFTILVILVVLIPVILAGVYFYEKIHTNLKNEAKKYLNYFIHQVNSDIESKFGIIDSTSLLFLSDYNISFLLDSEESTDIYKHSQNIAKFDEQLKSLLLFNYAWDSKLIKSIIVFKNEHNYYPVLRESYYQKVIQDNLKVFKMVEGRTEKKWIIPPTSNDPTIYFIRDYNDLNTLKYKGKLILGINQAVISNINKTDLQYENAQVFTFDNTGIIYSNTDMDLLGQNVDPSILNVRNSTGITEITINGKKYFAATKKINKYGLFSAVIVPKSDVFMDLNDSIKQYVFIILLITMISLFSAIFIYSRMTKPLRKLMEKITQVKNGNFEIKMPVYKYIELNELSNVFNTMTDEIHKLINEVYEKQLLLKESELESLQSQIKPHFIFNVLETISWQARMSNNEQIYSMVTSLGHLLRTNITFNNCEKITIRDELQYIEFYLNLQKVRFEDRMDVQLSISDDNILDYYLPKLCIQPIVENAVVHGLEEHRGKGIIKIQIWEEQSEIYFCVIDNGVGFCSSNITIDKINSVQNRREGHKSIGLYNVNKRIKLLYGDKYGLTIQSQPGVGTKATVCIPIDKEGFKNVQSNDC